MVGLQTGRFRGHKYVLLVLRSLVDGNKVVPEWRKMADKNSGCGCRTSTPR